MYKINIKAFKNKNGTCNGVLFFNKKSFHRYSGFFETISDNPNQKVKFFSRSPFIEELNNTESLKPIYEYSDMVYLTRQMIELSYEILEHRDIYSYKYLKYLRIMLVKLKLDMIRTLMSDSEVSERLDDYFLFDILKKDISIGRKYFIEIEKKVNQLFDSVLTVIVLAPVFIDSKMMYYSGFTCVSKKEEQDLIDEKYNFIQLSSIKNLFTHEKR